jgi:membrane protein implicated in regulation of membrane protease activity
MTWWLWILVGIVLLGVEVATPGGFFALFFGLGALAVSPLAAIGVDSAWQWLAFTALSIGSLASLRKWLQQRLATAKGPPIDSLVGQEAVLLEDLGADGVGKAELRGVPWSARSLAGVPLRAGQRCRVERVDGLTLWLRAE